MISCPSTIKLTIKLKITTVMCLNLRLKVLLKSSITAMSSQRIRKLLFFLLLGNKNKPRRKSRKKNRKLLRRRKEFRNKKMMKKHLLLIFKKKRRRKKLLKLFKKKRIRKNLKKKKKKGGNLPRKYSLQTSSLTQKKLLKPLQKRFLKNVSSWKNLLSVRNKNPKR